MVPLVTAGLLSCGTREGVLLHERLVESRAPLPWECPPEWIWQPSGGCGPAVMLCADSNAEPQQCSGVDLTRPRMLNTGSEAMTSFFRHADGSIGGGWSAREAISKCPIGWRPAGDGACEPDDSIPCPDGSVRAAGVCLSIGSETCEPGEYASVPPEAAGGVVVYVNRNGRASGATGTRDDPFPTIAEAIERAPEGAWVMLSEGLWREPLRPSHGVHVVGLCSDRSVIDARASTVAAIDVVGPSKVVDLRSLTIRGGAPSLRVTQRGSLMVHAAVIEGGTGAAIDVSDASVTLGDVAVRGVRRADANRFSVGLSASNRADVRVDRALFSDLDDRGFLIATRATVTASDVEIRDTHPSFHEAEEGANTTVVNCPDPDQLPAPHPADWTGEGARVEFGGGLRASRFVVSNASNDALVVIHRGSVVEIDDGVLRDTQPLPSGTDGKAAHITAAARVTLRRTLVERNHHAGLSAFCPNTVVDLSDVVVRGVAPRVAGGTAGRGLDAQWGGTIRARRSVVSGAHGASLFSYRGSTLEFTDSAVFDSHDSADVFSAAVLAYFESVIRLDHVLVDGFETAGLVASESGTSITVRDVIITHGRVSQRGVGLGVVAASNAVVEGDSLAVIDVPGAGIVSEGALRGALVHLSNVWVSNVTGGVTAVSYYRPVGSQDAPSRPRLLVASSSGRLELERFHGAGSNLGFVIAGSSGAHLSVRDGHFDHLATLGAVIDSSASPPSLVAFEDVSAQDVSDLSVRSSVR